MESSTAQSDWRTLTCCQGVQQAYAPSGWPGRGESPEDTALEQSPSGAAVEGLYLQEFPTSGERTTLISKDIAMKFGYI